MQLHGITLFYSISLPMSDNYVQIKTTTYKTPLKPSVWNRDFLTSDTETSYDFGIESNKF